MKTSTLQELKKELQALPPADLLELCLSLVKYKKENKELLTFLLFESGNKFLFIKDVKHEMEEQINELKSQSNLYLVKKGLRRLLRLLSKYSKFINDKALSADLYIYFCTQLKHSGIPYYKSQRITNLYNQQIKKINTLIATFHEDLRQDYLNDLEQLTKSS